MSFYGTVQANRHRRRRLSGRRVEQLSGDDACVLQASIRSRSIRVEGLSQRRACPDGPRAPWAEANIDGIIAVYSWPHTSKPFSQL